MATVPVTLGSGAAERCYVCYYFLNLGGYRISRSNMMPIGAKISYPSNDDTFLVEKRYRQVFWHLMKRQSGLLLHHHLHFLGVKYIFSYFLMN